MGEYEKEGREETARALKELREYCESPDFNAWKTVSRLQDPKRYVCFCDKFSANQNCFHFD